MKRDAKDVFISSTTTMDNFIWEFEEPVMISKLSSMHSKKNNMLDYCQYTVSIKHLGLSRSGH